MPDLPPDLVIFAARVFPLVFVAAWGACVGSLINVLAYRMPRGLSVVSPPSRCPSCETRLTWRENIPIFGWLILRGKCRFCRSRISPEYPIVETLVAALFTLVVAVWFVIPNPYGSGPVFLGLDWKMLQPDWARNGLPLMWPYVGVVLVLVGSLTAMTIIDAKTFTIPLALPWTATVVALLVHPAHALFVQLSQGSLQFMTIYDGMPCRLGHPGGNELPGAGGLRGRGCGAGRGAVDAQGRTDHAIVCGL